METQSSNSFRKRRLRLPFFDFNVHEPLLFSEAEVSKFGRGFFYKGTAFVHHSDLHHSETALYRLSLFQTFLLLFFLISIVAGFIFNWHATLLAVVAFLTVLYFADLLFTFFLIIRNFDHFPEITISPEEINSKPTSYWPFYTVFCPLYEEWNMLPQFVKAISHLDYPKERLQVLLLLEEDDDETIRHARAMELPSYFEISVVPHSLPKTKPKALNYGMLKAKGTHVVIYDAEDIPDPLQLKKAVLAFEKAPKGTVCIQAKLNFYNPRQNLLTRLFTAEYSLWFDLVLTGLQSMRAPIPLGGTSNHFLISYLRRVSGWDAFNVTEDCDLGMRLVKRGYRTAIINSVTLEESNSNLWNWMRQRSRWIKGYIQTYFVHMRNPLALWNGWREPHIVTFQLIVGGKILSSFLNPFMWIITFVYFTFRESAGNFIETFFPGPILYMGLVCLIFGNFLYLYSYMIACVKREQFDLVKYAYLVPFYWLMMSIAAWKALYQIIFKPHFWEKTQHGLHLGKAQAMTAGHEKGVNL